jgi:hypothetical protein
MTIKGHATRAQIDRAVDEQRREDRAVNGHRNGYSGDWQTIHELRGPITVLKGAASKNRAAIFGRMLRGKWVDGMVEGIAKREGLAIHTKLDHGRKVTIIIGLAAE